MQSISHISLFLSFLFLFNTIIGQNTIPVRELPYAMDFRNVESKKNLKDDYWTDIYDSVYKSEVSFPNEPRKVIYDNLYPAAPSSINIEYSLLDYKNVSYWFQVLNKQKIKGSWRNYMDVGNEEFADSLNLVVVQNQLGLFYGYPARRTSFIDSNKKTYYYLYVIVRERFEYRLIVRSKKRIRYEDNYFLNSYDFSDK